MIVYHVDSLENKMVALNHVFWSSACDVSIHGGTAEQFQSM